MIKVEKVLKRFFAIILVFLNIFLCTACGKSEKEETVNIDGEEFSFDSKIIVYSHKPDTMCPLLSKDESNVNMLQMIFDGLVDLSDGMFAVPELAETWSVSDDGKVWKFNLRQNATWHDGSSFEAKDVVYTVNQIKKNKNSIYYYNVSNIADIRAKDAHTLEIELNNPWLNAVNLFYFPIVKEQSGDIDAENFQPIGTGPYMFENRIDDSRLYLMRNEDWWEGMAETECVFVELLPDHNTALNAFSAGKIDMIMANDANWGKYVDADTASYLPVDSAELCFIGINNESGALAFAEVRKAISYAVDREEICNGTMMSYATPVNIPVHPNWEIGREALLETKQDADAAKLELYAYGWEPQGDGIHAKTIEAEQTDSENTADETNEVASVNQTHRTEFSLLYNEDNPLRETIALTIEKNLESVGIGITTEKVSYEEYESRISSGEYDLFVGSVIIAPDLDFAFILDEGNIFNFKNEEMYGLRESMRLQSDDEKAKLYAPLLEKFGTENPIVCLFFEKEIMIYGNRIEGDIKSTSFDVYRGIESLLKKEAKK